MIGNPSVATFVKDIIESVQAVIATLAIFLGGYWAYSRFIKGRLAHPHANITHQVTHRAVGNGKALLRVIVTIHNVGNVLLTMGESVVRIQQILPLPTGVEEAVREGKTPVNDGESEVRWPLIDSRELDLAKMPIRLEPGESDEIIYDFVLDGCPQTVKVYSHYSSAIIGRCAIFSKQRAALGWKRATIYDLVEGQDTPVSSVQQ